MGVYILATQSISPQDTFLKEQLPDSLLEYTSPLKNTKLNFKEYFPPLQARRISKLIKTSHTCAIETVKEAGIEKPDAIITASGLGCIEPTEKFLNDLLKTDEGLLAPTSFIQSTSNAVGAQIALHYGCTGYNVLFAQKSFSFESALLDTFLRINDKEEEFILLGGFDEITTENCQLKQNIGLYKKEPFSNLNIVRQTSSGSIPGESSSFFLLSSNKSENALAEVSFVETNYQKLDLPACKQWIEKALDKHSINLSDVDLILTGINGDSETDDYYNSILEDCFSHSTQVSYKQLCGEHDTASAFGTWFATQVIKEQEAPSYSIIKDSGRKIKNVLLYNQHYSEYHSLILLKSTDI